MIKERIEIVFHGTREEITKFMSNESIKITINEITKEYQIDNASVEMMNSINWIAKLSLIQVERNEQ